MISSRLTGRDSLLFVYGTLRPFVDIPMARWLRRVARYLGPATTRGRLYDLGAIPACAGRAARANGSSATSIASLDRACFACSIATKRARARKARFVRERCVVRLDARRPQDGVDLSLSLQRRAALPRIASGDYRACQIRAAERALTADVMLMVAYSRRCACTRDVSSRARGVPAHPRRTLASRVASLAIFVSRFADLRAMFLPNSANRVAHSSANGDGSCCRRFETSMTRKARGAPQLCFPLAQKLDSASQSFQGRADSGWRRSGCGLAGGSSSSLGLCSLPAAAKRRKRQRPPPAATAHRRSPARLRRPSIQGSAYSFAPSAADADGDALIFGIDAKPAWALFNTATGLLSGTPTAADVGMHRGIVVWVSDGKAQTVAAGVRPRRSWLRRAATTARRRSRARRPTSVVVGTPYTFTPTASDPDGQPLTFSIRNRPSWAAFDAATGRLQGTPPSTGTFADVTISVSDGQVAVPLPAFTIVVTPPPVNRPPVISGCADDERRSGHRLHVRADGQRSRRRYTDVRDHRAGPSWAAFDTSTGRLSGTPPDGHDGRRSATS